MIRIFPQKREIRIAFYSLICSTWKTKIYNKQIKVRETTKKLKVTCGEC